MVTSIFIPRLGQGINVKSETPLDDRGKSIFSSLGIPAVVIPSEAKSVKLSYLNRIYDGIGMYNKNGGLEFLNPQFFQDLYDGHVSTRNQSISREYEQLRRSIKTARRPEQKRIKEMLKGTAGYDPAVNTKTIPFSLIPTVTINSPGVLFFPYRKGKKTPSCCIFATLVDYLSYRALLKISFQDKKLPRCCDCIIVNYARNFSAAMLDSEDYDTIYGFFPETPSGMTMEATVASRNQRKFKSQREFYKGFRDLYEFMNHTKQSS